MLYDDLYRPETFNQVVGSFLNIAREQRNMTIDQVAKRTKLSPRKIEKIEQGCVQITVHQAKIIADVVGLDLAGVFSGGGEWVPAICLDRMYIIHLMQRVADILDSRTLNA